MYNDDVGINRMLSCDIYYFVKLKKIESGILSVPTLSMRFSN